MGLFRKMPVTGTKFAGISLSAFGVVSFFTACIGRGSIDCANIFLIFLSFSVLNGSRKAIPWAMGFSIFAFFCAVAGVSNAFVLPLPPKTERLINIVCMGLLGLWALLNTALLYRLNWYRATQKESPQDSESADFGSLPPSQSANQPFQFSLRSLLIISFIFAIACWLGTIADSPLYDIACSRGYSTISLPDGTKILLSYGILHYDSDVPLMGYLWTQKLHGPIINPPDPFQIGASSDGTTNFRVNGESIRLTAEFQLFVNDLENKPLRLTFPREEVKEYFCEPLDGAKLEKFWNEVVEPRRRAASPTLK